MSWTTLIFVVCTANLIQANDPCNEVDPGNRIDCGYFGITQYQCENDRNCCWGESDVEGTPWCFTKGLEAPPAEQCQTKPEGRTECGWFGVNQEQCESNGCCYGETDVGGAPWCFKPVDPACAAVDPDSRIDCGYFGINQGQCESDRGCCWDGSTEGDAPWCFTQGLPAPPVEECQAEPADRQDCGWVGVTQEQCESKGCCYKETDVEGAAWCFEAETKSA